ncbi:MAG: GNAT family N-acetyltransferase [Lachnospiraceae bacterium]|nr:GNAT family N-acetyltransferase [Lachnospiraceae bacterium]
MKIRELYGEEKLRSRILYEEMFPEDEEAFVDAYYRIKGACNRILVWEDQEELVSMLHLNPYRFRMRQCFAESSYIVAVATRESYRHQGLMRGLLSFALGDLYEKKQPFAFLMPAKEEIYTPFGFRNMKNQDQEKLAQASMEQLSREYDLFVWKDQVYQEQKIPAVEWETTPMMVRIVYLPGLLSQIGAKEPMELKLCISDELLPGNSGCYRWVLEETGSRLLPAGDQGEEPQLSTDAAQLGSFLFGAGSLEELFPAVPWQLRQKLEKIRVFQKIFINEVV